MHSSQRGLADELFDELRRVVCRSGKLVEV